MRGALRVLSLGAGVQSTAVLMLAVEGRLEPFDAAIFADTGWEPAAVYAHLARLERIAADAGLPVLHVTGGDIRNTGGALGTGAALDAPFHLAKPDGSHALARRQCTKHLKVVPIRRAVRAMLAARGLPATPGAATLAFGISADELGRMRTSSVRYMSHAYPLVDLRWRRADCVGYLDRLGIAAPRSACIGCPYHSDAEWRRIRDQTPSEWAEAVAWERDVQRAAEGRLVATPYVHRSRVPLDQVDLTTAEDHGQLTLADECEGLCGT